MKKLFILLFATTLSLPVAAKLNSEDVKLARCTAIKMIIEGGSVKNTPKTVSGSKLEFIYEMGYTRGIINERAIQTNKSSKEIAKVALETICK